MRESDASDIIDLSDTNFHANGIRYPNELVERPVRDYFQHRSYRPDPKGDAAARTAISGYYRERGVEIGVDQIFITASTSESYSLLFSSLAEAGDNVVLPAPTYPLFEYLAEFARLEARYYRMEFDGWFKLDVEEIRRRIDVRTRFVVLISPNNPTGRVASNEEIAALLKLCERTGTALITDEVFSEFVYADGNEEPVCLPRPAAHRSGATVFTLNGISKMFASPDLKLAWIAATGDSLQLSRLLDRIEIANDTFLSCSSLSQSILPSFFEHGRDFGRTMVERLDDNRKLLLESLGASSEVSGSKRTGLPPRSSGRSPLSCSGGLRLVPPNGGIHCVIGIPRSSGMSWIDDEDFAVQLLRNKGIYLHPGYFYGLEEGENEIYAVISFLKKRELLAEGLARVVSFV